MEYTRSFDGFVNSSLSFLRMPVASSLLTLFLVSYAGMAAPALPYSLQSLLKHAVIRVFILFLVVWSNNRNPTLSLAVALALVVGMNLLSGRSAFETFLVEQNTSIKPGCMGIKMRDILEIFGGDYELMRQELHNSGVPYNINLTDYDAPVIATYLVNHGYNLGKDCTVPM